jgi:subtilisin family serine protease
LDTGLDTNHIEFSTSGSSRVREVKNIYNAFVTNRYAPSADTDGHGHGTHVAGTIGGNTVGVARGVNIYSLKILSNDGEGETSDIILALELVHTKGSASNRRSIMSMSLGGSCDGDCEDDSLVLAVENLYEAGILSSVAAGNSGCNVWTTVISLSLTVIGLCWIAKFCTTCC